MVRTQDFHSWGREFESPCLCQSEYSIIWLLRSVWGREIASSNLATPTNALVAKLVEATDLGSVVERRGSSSLSKGTNIKYKNDKYEKYCRSVKKEKIIMNQKIKDFFRWEILGKLKGENVPVVAIMLMRADGQVLAQTAQKNNVINTNDSQYVFPGGKVEVKFGEKPYQAVHREMKEEANANVDIIEKLGKTRNNKYELHWYLCSERWAT